MMKIKEAKENQLKSILDEDDETDASGNVGISFAHIMYILKQQRKNKQYFDLLLFVIFVTLYIFILTSNRAAFATNGLTRGIKNILIDEAFNESEPGALYEDSRTYFDCELAEVLFKGIEKLTSFAKNLLDIILHPDTSKQPPRKSIPKPKTLFTIII